MVFTWTAGVRRRPRTAVALLALLLLAACISGSYLYALHEWRSAKTAVKENRPAEARVHLKICSLVWPRDTSVALLEARAARQCGDISAAEAHLNRCLKLNRDATADVELEFLLMRVQTGELDIVAQPLMECVLRKHSQAPFILETLSQAYLHNLRYGPALNCLDLWVQATPDSDEAHFLRGFLLERINDQQAAIKEFTRALELNPEHDRARLRLAELQLQRRVWEDALPNLELLHKKFPDRPDIQARLGHCRFLQNNLVEARRLMEAAVEKLPDDLPLLTQLARLEMQNNPPHAKQAEKWLRHALEIDKTDPETLNMLVSSLQAQNRTEEAEEVIERLNKNEVLVKRVNKTLLDEAKDPNGASPDALFEVGDLFLHNRQERTGLYWLERVLERDPNHAPTHKVLAEYYEKKGDLQRAEDHRNALMRAANADKPSHP